MGLLNTQSVPFNLTVAKICDLPCLKMRAMGTMGYVYYDHLMTDNVIKMAIAGRNGSRPSWFAVDHTLAGFQK